MSNVKYSIAILQLLIIAVLATAGSAPVRADDGQRPWGSTKIDVFVRNAHADAGLKPSRCADRSTLIRRLSFDLTGLPPTPREVDSFVLDQAPDAYERLVERLLASPRFGERMAQLWLDLARYADSDGYHDDTNRAMWPYRDWVIDAFNRNMPFDQFTIQQLAGDLLPTPTTQQIVATAFLRNGPTSSEDGANPDEYRARYAVDRVNTMSQVWLGLTIQCAECHDHKYDPISTKEYYQLFDFFNQSPEQPLFRGLHAPPSVALPSKTQTKALAEIEDRITSAKRLRLEQRTSLDSPFEAWRARLAELPPRQQTSEAVVCEFSFEGQRDAEFLRNTGSRRRSARVRSSDGNSKLKSVFGWLGQGIRFDGSGSALDVGQLFEVRRALPFTAETWVAFEKPGGPIFHRMDPDNNSRGFELRVNRLGHLVVRLIDQWPDAAIQVSTTDKFEPREWIHVSVTYDGLAGPNGIHIYVNGAAQDIQVDHDGKVSVIRNRSPFLIGGAAAIDESFCGTIDEVRLYKWALPSQALTELPLRGLHKISLQVQDGSDDAAQAAAKLRSFFADFVHVSSARVRRDQLLWERKRHALEQRIPRLRVMKDIEDRRPTHVLVRGNFRELGEQVIAGTPEMLPPISEKRNGDHPTRLDLARWLVRENRTHTARVFANRLWAALFGRGIITTLDDFGANGAPATHPQLLDWMAEELVRTEWDTKALLRRIVNSDTYRQSSAVSREQRIADPLNQALTRMDRQRLSAEAIRDNALAVSGLLSTRMLGPSVYPYQPAGLWREMAKGNEESKSYQQDEGESLYRRGIYTFWKRSIHYPSFALLDAPSREFCTSSRPSTNTAVQALVLLNDPTFVDAADAFARTILAAENTVERRLDFAFRKCLARKPTRQERSELQSLLRELSVEYADAESPVLAAWTALAQVVLSLDEAITKE